VPIPSVTIRGWMLSSAEIAPFAAPIGSRAVDPFQFRTRLIAASGHATTHSPHA